MGGFARNLSNQIGIFMSKYWCGCRKDNAVRQWLELFGTKCEKYSQELK